MNLVANRSASHVWPYATAASPSVRALGRIAAAAVLLLLLAACGSGPVKRVFPPSAAIQQLVVESDGSWTISLRVQNFGNVGLGIASVQAQVDVGGSAAGRIDIQPGVVVPASSAEVFTVTMQPSFESAQAVADALQTDRGVGYLLTGTIVADVPERRRDRFEFASSLARVPGLQNTLR